jgi:diacylglycerol kinase family enzyme
LHEHFSDPILKYMQRVLFLVNPLMGSKRTKLAAVDRCVWILRAEDCEAEIRETLSRDNAAGQAREAVASGIDTIFACGGDGTVFYVLQGIAGSPAAMGILPLGTGNVLARNLGLPRDPEAAFRAQRKAIPTEIPLGEVICGERGWYFTIAAGIGLHAALMNVASSGQAKRIWGRTAYYAGGVGLLLRRNVQPLDVNLTEVSGKICEFRACELLALRVPVIDGWRTGGELLSPHLRVAAVPHTGRLGLAYASFHGLVTSRSGEISAAKRRLPCPSYADAAQVVCRPTESFPYKSPLLVQADGEVIGAECATLRMAQKRLRLLWPIRRAGF